MIVTVSLPFPRILVRFSRAPGTVPVVWADVLPPVPLWDEPLPEEKAAGVTAAPEELIWPVWLLPLWPLLFWLFPVPYEECPVPYEAEWLCWDDPDEPPENMENNPFPPPKKMMITTTISTSGFRPPDFREWPDEPVPYVPLPGVPVPKPPPEDPEPELPPALLPDPEGALPFLLLYPSADPTGPVPNPDPFLPIGFALPVTFLSRLRGLFCSICIPSRSSDAENCALPQLSEYCQSSLITIALRPDYVYVG